MHYIIKTILSKALTYPWWCICSLIYLEYINIYVPLNAISIKTLFSISLSAK